MSAQGWQPIETAPRDGTKILCFDDCGFVVIAHWMDNWVVSWNGDSFEDAEFWMPIPKWQGVEPPV